MTDHHAPSVPLSRSGRILEESEYSVCHVIQSGKHMTGEVLANQKFVVALPVVGIQSGTRIFQPRLESCVLKGDPVPHRDAVNLLEPESQLVRILIRHTGKGTSK